MRPGAMIAPVVSSREILQPRIRGGCKPFYDPADFAGQIMIAIDQPAKIRVGEFERVQPVGGVGKQALEIVAIFAHSVVPSGGWV